MRSRTLAAAVMPLLLVLAACSAIEDAVDEVSEGVEDATTVNNFKLDVGDCFEQLSASFTIDEATLESLEAVPCDGPHAHELFAKWDMPEDEFPDFPGETAVEEYADVECSGQFVDYVGPSQSDINLSYVSIYPISSSWNAGDREIVCYTEHTNGDLTESVKDVFRFEVGTCLNDSQTTLAAEGITGAVPCDQPHDDELFFLTELPEGDWPGDTGLQEAGDAACLAEFQAYVGAAYESSTLYSWTLAPTEGMWNSGHREISCLLYTDGPMTGSMQGSGT